MSGPAGDRSVLTERIAGYMEEYAHWRSFGTGHDATVANLAPRLGLGPRYLHDIVTAQKQSA